MDIGIRFSSPVLDEMELDLLKEDFGYNTEEVLDILESAPYEISIIVSLIKRLETTIRKLKI